MARKVTSRVELYEQNIKKMEKAIAGALEKTAEALHDEVEQAQVIPFDTGALQNEKSFVDMSEVEQGKATIGHEGPYARRLYYHPEYNFQTTENPNAKGQWYEDWLEDGEKEDFIQDAFSAILKREMDKL